MKRQIKLFLYMTMALIALWNYNIDIVCPITHKLWDESVWIYLVIETVRILLFKKFSGTIDTLKTKRLWSEDVYYINVKLSSYNGIFI